MDNELIIDNIIKSLTVYNLGDIKFIRDQKESKPIAAFILCSCFIDHVSGFRYGKCGKRFKKIEMRYSQFVIDYINDKQEKYNPKKLYSDLRNKLVHNYSLTNYYAICSGQSITHLKKTKQNQICLNLENFVDDLENALIKYVTELKNNNDIKQLALSWYNDHKILTFSETQIED